MTKTLSPQAAGRAASAAHQAVADTERAIAGGERVGVDELTAIVTRAHHADLTAAATRDQAEKDREQGRQEALAALGTEIDTLAGAGAEGLADALAGIAGAVGRARRAAGAWDAHLAEVARAARALGCREPAEGGPREADQRVAVTRDGTVSHGENVLKPVAGRIVEALRHAMDGDVVSAVASARVHTWTRAQVRAGHYLRGAGGMIVPVYGDLDATQLFQVKTGGLVELTESQVRAHLAGEPFDLTEAQEFAYSAGRR